MSGYHGPDGYQHEPMDPRASEHPNRHDLIDPYFSGPEAGDRDDRHESLGTVDTSDARVNGEKELETL